MRAAAKRGPGRAAAGAAPASAVQHAAVVPVDKRVPALRHVECGGVGRRRVRCACAVPSCLCSSTGLCLGFLLHPGHSQLAAVPALTARAALWSACRRSYELSFHAPALASALCRPPPAQLPCMHAACGLQPGVPGTNTGCSDKRRIRPARGETPCATIPTLINVWWRRASWRLHDCTSRLLVCVCSLRV